MPADRNTQLFWLKFAQAIQSKSGTKGGVLFVASRSIGAPIVSDNIPEEYTNTGLFAVGNSLLSTDDLFYHPVPELGYAETLQGYLNWIDLGPHFPPPLQQYLLNANRDFESSQRTYSASIAKARTRFGRDQIRGMTAGQTFAQWIANGNSPDCIQAERGFQSTSAQIQSLQQQGGGPNTVAISNARAATTNALTVERDYPGLNMRCALGDSFRAPELNRKFESTERIDPSLVIHRPSYLAPTYKAFGTEAQKLVGKPLDAAKMDSTSISISDSDDPSAFKFGRNTSGGFNYGPWLSFRGSDQYSETSTVDINDAEASSVSVKVVFSKLESIAIVPGAWNSNDLSSLKLRSDAPQIFRSLARVSSMIVASQLGYEITFGDSLAQKLESKIAETKNRGGILSVFGLPASLEDHSGESDDVEHQARWNNAAKTLTVSPSDGSGAATVVALVGEKIGAS